MREIFKGRRPMVTAEQMRAEAQPKLLRIIEHLVAGGHPTMAAYRKAADQIGRRPAWIQRVIGRRDQVVVAAHDWLNITTLCDRLDAASARNEAAADAIRRGTNATLQARAVTREAVEVARQSRKGKVRPLVDEVGQ
jgi:hypothetical protein